jgi:uncharacterized membrane protein
LAADHPDDTASPSPEEGAKRRAVVLLTAAAILIALTGLRAELVGARAQDGWEHAVRVDLKSASVIEGDLLTVYGGQAPRTLTAQAARAEAEELQRQAGAAPAHTAALLRAEAGVHARLGAVSGDQTLDRPRYRRGDVLLVPLAVADLRARTRDLPALDPDAAQQEADDRRHQASVIRAAALPAGVAFLFAALTEAFPRRRRLALYALVALAVSALIWLSAEVLL